MAKKDEISRRDFIKGIGAGAYTPGTCSATAKGIGSDVSVTMTFGRRAAKIISSL